jgi:Flp pilus assembly protein TadG
MSRTRHEPETWGQALVEFALIVPFFVLLLMGIIDLGRYVSSANALNNAAREGARFSSVAIRPAECNGLSREQCARTVTTGRVWGASSSPTVTVSCTRFAKDGTSTTIAVSSCRTNDLLAVRATAPFTLVTPVISQFLGSLTLNGEARVTVNQ